MSSNLNKNSGCRDLAIVIVVLVIVFVGVFYFTPKPPPKKIYTYKIAIIKPDGKIHKEFDIATYSKVERITNWNGTVSVVSTSNLSFDWESDAIAPVGWNADYTLKEIREENETGQ